MGKRRGFPTALGMVIVAGIALSVAGCQSKVTKENAEKIQVGMTLAQVEKILGEGRQSGDGSGVAAQFGVDVGVTRGSSNTQTFVWESDNHKITVHFVDGVVKTKDFR